VARNKTAVKKFIVTLSDEERGALTALIHTGKHPAQKLLKARILLKADASDAGEGWSEAVTEFHIVGGLHPELTLDWYCEMLRGLKQRFPKVHLKAFTMVEIGYLARRTKISAVTRPRPH
jgi:hypothetical protein